MAVSAWGAGEPETPDGEEIEVDYGYITQACEAAAKAPAIPITDLDRAAYTGLGEPSYVLDIDYEE